jgi:hypothetical protein
MFAKIKNFFGRALRWWKTHPRVRVIVHGALYAIGIVTMIACPPTIPIFIILRLIPVIWNAINLNIAWSQA